MSNDEIIKNAIDKFHSECSKITDTNFTDKIKKHEEIIIKVILETILNNKSN